MPVRFLLWLCASRLSLSLIFTAYAGVLPFVRTEWELSAAKAATIQSAWNIGYLVSLFAVGLIADRFGARRTYLASSLLAAAAALAFAVFGTAYASALVLYGLTALCSGGSYTPGLAIVYQMSDNASRGRAMGWFLASSSLGYALSLGLVALMCALLSWRAAVAVTAVATLIGAGLGFVALSGVPEPPRTASTALGLWPALRETVRDRRAMACNWSYTFHCWELLGLWAWLPSFLAGALAASAVAQGTSLGIAIAAFAHLVAVAGSIVGGSASDRLGRAAVMALATAASVACSFLVGWLWAAPLWVLIVIAAFYSLAAIADSSVYSTALAESVPPERLGAAYSVRSVMGFGAGAVSPVVFGAALDLGARWLPDNTTLVWALAWSSLGLVSLFGLLTIRRFARLVVSS